VITKKLSAASLPDRILMFLPRRYTDNCASKGRAETDFAAILFVLAQNPAGAFDKAVSSEPVTHPSR